MADLGSSYDEQKSASHDAFIFTPPVPSSVIRDVGNLAVNTFRAENVVVAAWQRPGRQVVNPLTLVVRFTGCISTARCSTRRRRISRRGVKRGVESFSVAKSGWVHGRDWMQPEMVQTFGETDCLALGL